MFRSEYVENGSVASMHKAFDCKNIRVRTVVFSLVYVYDT